MRACSFLPAATSIVSDLDLAHLLVGVSFECELDRPRVVHSVLEGQDLTSAEIDHRVSTAAALNEPLYRLDESLLETLAPDVIFTQDVCSACQIDSACVAQAVERLTKKPRVISLTPHKLRDVFENIRTIAVALDEPAQGENLVASLVQRIEAIAEKQRKERRPVRKVSLLEWIEPMYNCGHWIPELIELAGGEDRLANPGGYSTVLPWEKLREYDPEIIVVAACGFDAERIKSEMKKLNELPGWSELRAVRGDRVFAADSRLFTQPSAKLVDGIELLAKLFG